MELIATLKEIFPVESGNSKSGGTWTKQCFLVQTEGPYPKEIFLEDFSDRANVNRFQPGEMIRISVDLSSRSHNGRYYTTASARNIEPYGDSTPAAAPATRQPTGQSVPPIPQVREPNMPASFTEEEDSLPF